MNTVELLQQKKKKLAVVGLGYVGMPLAVAFAEKFPVIGYDRDERKISQYKKGIDLTAEVGGEALKQSGIEFTTDPGKLSEACFIIVAVPTPINADNTPDLKPVEEASKVVGENIHGGGTLIVYESTVYPGVTEDVCVPIIEQRSGLVCGKDFYIGYSPERINPGDKQHRLKNITKIVSGMNEESRAAIAEVYGSVITHIYQAPTIKVAEAAKLVENSQRDINIAFMNELAMVFHRMDIDTAEVVKAMNTKWNALKFQPGLVGGHCISVDPYYFIYAAEKLGYHSPVVTIGRQLNNGMSEFVAREIIKSMMKAKINTVEANIYILGMTFKENCPDTRNSQAVEVYHRLADDYGLDVKAVDPWLDEETFQQQYHIPLHQLSEVKNADCLLFLVAHDEFRQLTMEQLEKMYHPSSRGKRVIVDVKSMFSREALEHAGYVYWNL
jgi:UDP-N-acetyl-D-galactosamine dehydrogenase